MGGPREWEEREEGGGRNEEGMVCDHVDVSVFLCVVGSCSIVGCTRHPHIFLSGRSLTLLDLPRGSGTPPFAIQHVGAFVGALALASTAPPRGGGDNA